jgi:hypothetical protein
MELIGEVYILRNNLELSKMPRKITGAFSRIK